MSVLTLLKLCGKFLSYRRYGSIFVKDVWSQDIKLASRYLYLLNS
jgi:hypothetical protein